MKLSLGIRALSLSLNKERVARRIATATMRDASIDISFTRSSAPSSKQPLRGLALSGTLGDLEIIDGSARRREWAAPSGFSASGVKLAACTAFSRFATSHLLCLCSPRQPSRPSHHPSPLAKTEEPLIASDGVPYASCLELRLSPMRFVYLHQQWLELVDYFFNGLLNEHIWSGPNVNQVPPAPVPQQTPHATSASPTPSAELRPRQRFFLHADAPKIVLPAHMDSTQSLALTPRTLVITRRYTPEEGASANATISHFDIALTDLSCTSAELASDQGSEPQERALNPAQLNPDGTELKVDASWPVLPHIRENQIRHKHGAHTRNACDDALRLSDLQEADCFQYRGSESEAKL